MTTIATTNMDKLRDRICSNVTSDCSLPSAAISYLLLDRQTILLHARITCTALVLIFAASHGAIQRPHSAAPASRRRRHKDKDKDKDCDHEDNKTHQYAQSFMASDVIMFPLAAGTVLTSLYYIIRWLDDPELLNRILRWWLGTAGLVAATVFYHDVLGLVVSVVLPDCWRGWRGEIYVAGVRSRRVFRLVSSFSSASSGTSTAAAASVAATAVGGEKGGAKDEGDVNYDLQEKHEETWRRLPSSAFPAPYPIPFGGSAKEIAAWLAWEARNLFRDKWAIVVDMPGTWSVPLKGRFTLAYALAGMAAAIVAALQALEASFFAGDSRVNNISGLAMSYGTMLMMSPTSFPIGTAVLVGLCVYDIVMVFYTPFMITVAQAIDAPVKLTFESPIPGPDGTMGVSILGLGDIIIPGILIAMCLRFDLYRHYQCKMAHEPITFETGTLFSDTSTQGKSVRSPEQQYMTKKSTYVDPTGRWGDWLWLRSKHSNTTKFMRDVSFRKPYFWAAMTGYALGMVVTFLVLNLSQHGQPALLYLVPSTVGAVWLTGLVRGEVRELWEYSEDGSGNVEDAVAALAAPVPGTNGTKNEAAGDDVVDAGEGGEDEEKEDGEESGNRGKSSKEGTREGKDEDSGGGDEDKNENMPLSELGNFDEDTTSFEDSDDEKGDFSGFDLHRDVLFIFSVVKPRRLRRRRRLGEASGVDGDGQEVKEYHRHRKEY